MTMRGFGCLALVAMLAITARAQDEKQPTEAEKAAADAQKGMQAMFAGMTKFVGETRLNEKGVKSVLEHWKSFEAIGEKSTEKEDADAIQKAVEESYKKTGVYDFSVLLQHAQFKKWVAKTGVDGKAWLQQYLRASMIFMRADLLSNYEQMKAEAKRQFEELEKMKAQLSEQQYEQIKKAMEVNVAATEGMAKAAKNIPEPDKAEQELLKKYGSKLRAITGDDEDEGCGEQEDEDDGDMDDGDEDEDEDEDEGGDDGDG